MKTGTNDTNGEGGNSHLGHMSSMLAEVPKAMGNLSRWVLQAEDDVGTD